MPTSTRSVNVVAKESVREGITAEWTITLSVRNKETKLETPFDLTGVTEIALYLRPQEKDTNKDDRVIDQIGANGLGTLTISPDPTTGVVILAPTETTFLAEHNAYYGYFRITNAAGKTFDFPRASRFEMIVVEKFGV